MTDKLKIAVMALRNILEPIKYLQDKAKEDGAKLDGYMAIQLTQNASLYQEIARKALEAVDTVVEWAEKPLPTDEQIREMSNEYARKHTEPKAGYVLNRRFGFQNGATWMRDLIRDKRSQVEEEIVPTQKICPKCGSELINTEQYGWFCPDIACRIEGQNQHLNNTTYTAEDMEAFAEWMSLKEYSYHPKAKMWTYGMANRKTTEQLRELWENERRAK